MSKPTRWYWFFRGLMYLFFLFSIFVFPVPRIVSASSTWLVVVGGLAGIGFVVMIVLMIEDDYRKWKNDE